MKILYGIQGTGHGHISRAREILPLLTEKADINVLISGYNCNMTLEDIRVIHKKGISLAYDSKGSVSYLQTALKIKPVRFIQDIHQLNTDQYDMVISDYEPISAWASLHSETPLVGLSHQASFLSKKSPRPEKRSLMGEQILKYFAPVKTAVGFHFRRYDSFILPPIIRKEVRDLEISPGNHITVYLPAFDHETLTSIFIQCKQTEWHIFSPFCTVPYQKDHVHVKPVGNKPFLESMKDSIGVVTSAGFETCAEAMYLGKKLIVIPIQDQYEQLCNAAALHEIGITVIDKLDGSFRSRINSWLSNPEITTLNEIADTEDLTNRVIQMGRKHSKKKAPAN